MKRSNKKVVVVERPNLFLSVEKAEDASRLKEQVSHLGTKVTIPRIPNKQKLVVKVLTMAKNKNTLNIEI